MLQDGPLRAREPLPQLRYLRLRGHKSLSGKRLAAFLALAPALELLDVRDCPKLGAEAWSALSGLPPALRTLAIGDGARSQRLESADRILACAASALPRLEAFFARRTALGAGLTRLAERRGLRTLDVCGAALDCDSLFAALAALPALTALGLGRTAAGADPLLGEALAALPALRAADLAGASQLDLTDLPGSLTSLSLAGVAAPASEVAELIARSASLLHLDLAENDQISDQLWEEPALANGVQLTAVGAYKTEMRAAPPGVQLTRSQLLPVLPAP